MDINPLYIMFGVMPAAVLGMMCFYAYSCWGKWSRGEEEITKFTMIDTLCFLGVMLALSSGSEDQNRIMFIITGGVVSLMVLKAINSSVGWIVRRKLRRRAQASLS